MDGSKRQLWEVVGGSKSGLTVRVGKELASNELPGRLAKDALVWQEELVGERLRYKKLSGEGPDSGWVSLKLKGQPLLRPSDKRPRETAGGGAQPQLSREEALSMQRDLRDAFGSRGFQAELKALLARYPAEARAGADFLLARGDLVLAAQVAVVQKYGFEGNRKGASRMERILTKFSQTDAAFGQAGLEINVLLRLQELPPARTPGHPRYEDLSTGTLADLKPPLAQALEAFAHYASNPGLRSYLEQRLKRDVSEEWVPGAAIAGQAACGPEAQDWLWERLAEVVKVKGLSLDALVDAGIKEGTVTSETLGYWMWWCKSAWEAEHGPRQVPEAEITKHCYPHPKLLRRKPMPPAESVRPSGAWPCKLGDPQRTAATSRVATRRLECPQWSFYTFGLTYASPLIDEDGNIYLATTQGELFSLRPDGELRWSFHVFHGGCENPVLYGGAIFFSDLVGHFYAVGADTGLVRWLWKGAKNASGGVHSVTAGEGLAIFHTHLVPEGTFQWSEESEFVACDATSGEERWRTRVDVPFYNVAAAFTTDGSALVATDMNGGVHKLVTKTGTLLWTSPGYPFPMTPEEFWFAPPGNAPRSHGALVIADDRAGRVYSSGNPTRTSGRVRAHSLETGEVLWSTDLQYMMGNAGALADIGGVSTLVVGTGITALHPIPEGHAPFKGIVYGLEAASGSILWTYQVEDWIMEHCAGSITYHRCPEINMPDAFAGPAVDGNGTVYIAWHGGLLLALDGRDGTLISKWRWGEGSQSTPAIGPCGELVVTAGFGTHSFWPDSS